MPKGPPKGTRYPGAGRVKGQPNKDTKELRELLAQACGPDWNPVIEMAKTAKTGLWPLFDPLTGRPEIDELTGLQKMGRVNDKIRSRFAEESSQYFFPKRKAVEMTDGEGNPLLQRMVIEFDGPDGD